MSQNVKPATSVHFNYTLPHCDYSKIQNIVLHNEIEVEKSHDCTYFCVLHFWPAGYCGLQQCQGNNDKIAIFSVWDGKREVKSIDVAAHAKVQKFGGEGNGLKCTKPLQWAIGETIGFTVIANKVSESLYYIRCNIEFRSEEIYMCTYEYNGLFPIQSMSCFVEDWQRCDCADGLLYERSAKFSKAYCFY